MCHIQHMIFLSSQPECKHAVHRKLRAAKVNCIKKKVIRVCLYCPELNLKPLASCFCLCRTFKDNLTPFGSSFVFGVKREARVQHRSLGEGSKNKTTCVTMASGRPNAEISSWTRSLLQCDGYKTKAEPSGGFSSRPRSAPRLATTRDGRRRLG